jgi:hypothetical protein
MDDANHHTLSAAEAANLLGLSERHLYRLARAQGIAAVDGRFPARQIADLAINRAIAGSEHATALRLLDVTERLRDVEAGRPARRARA